ncbi:MAG: hypothetical protein R3B90_22115 [Planctomycetaceae bacterium]
MMLGLCGNADDAKLLEQKVLASGERYRIGLDGIMAGYVLLTGEQGMDLIDREKVADKSEEFSEHIAAAQMIRFLWQYAPDAIPKRRLIASMRKLVDNSKVADVVIPDLARWEDWGLTEHLVSLYGTEGYDIPFIQRKILHFCMAAVDSVPEGTTEPPKYAAVAGRFLKKIERRPELYNLAKKGYYR